ncbi:AsmA-like C-terminal region-containing protein [Mucilaginibacter sabulilitoris]|uniref:AsmA-like C-terminal region-containing protein n=1 Tax=Mucilaginibacter sabulilitoris TaxID=1173583 RepID=A0ABZ0TNG2_9SPHI|nr:AsmA-like C-terminal region-containing protein [Mucilaginibacter sabulilitoris]WPU93244.1 AsmA-like C-terminal region-containing protein [Mucilaginibacter sabulilitoris]
MPKWLKIILKVTGGIIALVIVACIVISVYIAYNKQKVLNLITTELNKNLNGTLTIGNIDPTFFKGFPGVSIVLKDVMIKDKLWANHRHTLLNAKELYVSVNAMALLKGTVDINKIEISNADIDLFTDSTGYSNTAVFKAKPKDNNKPEDKSSSTAQLKRFELSNVNFTVDDRKAFKLFKFQAQDVNGRMDYPATGWNAHLKLKTMVKSFSFNTQKGSFMKDKLLTGPFDIRYDSKSKLIVVAPNKLGIGDDTFTIGAKFNLAKGPADFTINIVNDKILWTSAANLLAPNITKSLNMFNIDNPIAVTCDLNGSFAGGGDPLIFVTAKVKNNTVTTPGGKIDDCSFNGIFSNNYINGKGLNDDNSIIKLYHFNGKYKQIPFTVDTAFINNLNVPVATGIFKSHFDVAKLNPVIGEQSLKFTKGTADLKLAYKAPLINFKLNKPILSGTVNIKNADVSYLPRNLHFKNTGISLKFAGNDLLMNNIRLQTGNSVAYMEGRVNNFLNLYYTAPEKILITWQINSPQLHIAEFLGFLNARKSDAPIRSKSGKVNLHSQLNTAFDKGKAELHLRVAKVYYKKFLATDATADLLLADNSIRVQNVRVKHAGGSLKLAGNIIQKGTVNTFLLNTQIDNVNTSNFFYSFNNFGLKSFTYQNLKGFLSAQAHITGSINNEGNVVPRSINGVTTFELKKGALVNFSPIQSVGKFAFPFRDLENITFSNLKGQFNINGDKIVISPMQINSNVLNMDVAGVYSLSKGTNIALDIPLRNPKKDTAIVDQNERNKKRMRGIVLHILATDGEDGKIKIKWNKNRPKKEKPSTEVADSKQ